MKKKNTFLGVALLIAVLVLGIGYALTINGLKVTGTATAKEDGSNFNVIFTAADTDDDTVNAEIDASDAQNKTAIMDVTLGKVGESVSAWFTIENTSANGITAVLDPSNVTLTSTGGAQFDSTYFDVVYDLGQEEAIELTPEHPTVDLFVTVTLKKAVIGDPVENTFFITLDGITAKAAE